MSKRKACLLLILVLGLLVGGCAGSAATATPTPTAASMPESSLIATSAPMDLGPMPVPPPTAVPAWVTVEVEGIISSSSGRVPDYKYGTDPTTGETLYGHIVATMYVTRVVEGAGHLQAGDTIILNDCCLVPGVSPVDLPQPGTAFHIRGLYRSDTGVMQWANALDYLGEVAAYGLPPIVGEPGDIVRVSLNVTVAPRSEGNLPELLVGSFPALRVIDEDWAQVVTGTVRLGELVGVPELFSAEVLKTAP